MAAKNFRDDSARFFGVMTAATKRSERRAEMAQSGGQRLREFRLLAPTGLGVQPSAHPAASLNGRPAPRPAAAHLSGGDEFWPVIS